MSETMTPIPQNYKNNVDWILGAYTDAGITFPNGFQKDAIQNAVGARRTNKWRDFICDISLVETSKGKFLVVEDSGTVGLTGRNIPAADLNIMMSRNEKLTGEERLARFTSMFNSGDNKTGGGLYGAGKSVYSVASSTYTYYFDSYREDGKYVANVNQCGIVEPIAFEGEEAHKYILEKTGLQKKDTCGTRVIIEAPKEELVESITSGDIIPYIQESWWIILQRLGEGSQISVNRIPVQIPGIKNTATHKYELTSPETITSGYRVKNFGLYVYEDGSNVWKGISYYRKGMKIGEIEIKEIPEKIEDKYWGYVEVDEEWENALSDIEDKVHFGVSKGKKGTTTYQRLRNFCQQRFTDNLIGWGFIRDKENEDKKLNDELKKMAEDLQDLFDKLKFEDLGTGPQKSTFNVRWQDVVFPIEGSERVSTGDSIHFSVRITSSYTIDKKFLYRLFIMNPQTNELIYEIEKSTVTIPSKSFHRMNFVHTITQDNSKQFAENRIILEVSVVGSGKQKTKELSYFFDIDRLENHRNLVKLTLHECILPHDGCRRINFEDSINNVCYLLENKRNHLLKYRLNVSIHYADDPACPKIVDVASLEGEVKPYEDVISEYISEILFERSIYEPYLPPNSLNGVLELRARIIAAEDDEEFEKGDKITYYHYKLFLNCDEKHGKNDAFDVKSIEAPDKYLRSWHTPGTGRTIYLNVGHTAYLNVKNLPEVQYEYLREQMLKQYVCLYLAEGKYDMFGDQGKEFSQLEPQEATNTLIEKIEWVYNESLR